MTSRDAGSWYSLAGFESELARLGATPTQNFWAWVGNVADFVAGAANALTAGLVVRVLNGLPANWLVNTNSTAFQIGSYVGQAIGVVLSLFPPYGMLGTALFVTQAIGNYYNAQDAFKSGDFWGGVLSLSGMGLSLTRQITSCTAFQSVFNNLAPGLGTQLATAIGTAAAVGVKVLGGIGVYSNVTHAISAFGQGDYIGGLLSLAQAGADFYHLSQSCFTGEMPIVVRHDGTAVRIDQLRERSRAVVR